MAQLKERASAGPSPSLPHHRLGVSDSQALDLYAKMVLARNLDERLWALNRQGKVPLLASCQGLEAASLGNAFAALQEGGCFFFSYYRELPLRLMLGLSPLDVMVAHYGKASDVFNAGRQFLFQGYSPKHPIIINSNVVGSSLCHAAGYALGCKTLGEDTVVLVSFGDGGSSEGEAHEAMNFAGIHKLPIVFLCYNNKLAISVPQRKQMAVENLSDRAAGYGFPGYSVDGPNIFEVIKCTREAIQRARAKDGGPTLLELKVERLKPHTSDDDDRKYRTPEELDAARRRDPLPIFRSYLVENDILTDEQDQRIQAQVKEEIDRATDAVENEPWPDPSTLLDHVYSP
jgi:2-oxoisovalerate dehydrogenase E1 component alpha subunit